MSTCVIKTNEHWNEDIRNQFNFFDFMDYLFISTVVGVCMYMHKYKDPMKVNFTIY